MNEILREEVENRLKLSIDDADYLRNDIFKKIEKIKELNKKFDIEVDLNSFTKIANYRLFLNLLISDISSAILFYLNSKSKYEQIYSVRLIIVCINEGYKKIYHFTNTKKNGEIDLENRNKSFWIKDIRAIINNEIPELTTEFDSITNQLDIFWDEKLNDFQNTRNLSIHYDFETTKVYDEIIKILPEETFQKLIPFLDILNKMFDLTIKLTEHLLISSKTKNNAIKENNNQILDNLTNLIINSNIDEDGKILDTLEKLKHLNNV